MLMGPEERRTGAEEAAEANVCLPYIPSWMKAVVADYTAKVSHEGWPSKLSELAKFAQTMRRTEETLASSVHGTDRGTLRWMTIAWGKQNGQVSQDLNRTDKHGNEIPYWVSEMLWNLQGGKPAPLWHRRWRSILTGLLARVGIESATEHLLHDRGASDIMRAGREGTVHPCEALPSGYTPKHGLHQGPERYIQRRPPWTGG